MKVASTRDMSRPVYFLLLLVLGASSVFAKQPRRRSFLITLNHDNDLTVYNVRGELLARLANDLKFEPQVLHVRDLVNHAFPLFLELDPPCNERDIFNAEVSKDDEGVSSKSSDHATMSQRDYLEAPQDQVTFKHFPLNIKGTTTPLYKDPRPLPLVKYLTDKLDDTNEPTYESTVHLRGPWPVARYGPNLPIPTTVGGNRLLNLGKRATDYHYKVKSFAGSTVA